VEGVDTAAHESKTAALEKGPEGTIEVDVVGPLAASSAGGIGSLVTTQRATSQSHTHAPLSIVAPSPLPATFSPALSPMDLRPPTPAASKPPTPVPGSQTPTRTAGSSVSATGSVFALPYRMLFAVVTMDTVAIYDTQQAGPVCLLTKLHYDEFTDMTWSVSLPISFSLFLTLLSQVARWSMFDLIVSGWLLYPHYFR
jgi:chromatin assembly factor 1 subunit B